MTKRTNTTATQLTPRGRGAVASIIIEGSLDVLDELFHAANSKPAAKQHLNRICYGLWGKTHQEDVVGFKLDDKTFEVHCHGGSVAVDRILNDLESAGLAIQKGVDASAERQAFQSEFTFGLQRATTQKTAHLILRQSKVFPAAVEALGKLGRDEASLRANRMLKWSDFGKHLIQPWQVVLCGSPNVGKSSLINALVGFSRSVVFDQPGTTRDVVTVQTALQGWPIEFSDTAGLRETDESLETLGIEKAKEKIRLADLLIVVVDARKGISEFEETLMKSHVNSLLVANKIDLIEDTLVSQKILTVSATEAVRISHFSTEIVNRLVPELPTNSQPFPITDRQIRLLNEFIN